MNSNQMSPWKCHESVASPKYDKIMTCRKGCCNLYIDEYNPRISMYSFSFKRSRYKAGALFYDPVTQKILIVQSRGLYWGAPKGSMDEGETSQECAIREIKEETGLNIFIEELTRPLKIKNKAIYYYIEMPECNVEIQRQIIDNDANAVGWIKIECLKDLEKMGKIRINQHLRQLLYMIRSRNNS